MRCFPVVLILAASIPAHACHQALCWEPRHFAEQGESGGGSWLGIGLGLGVAGLAGGGGGGSPSSPSGPSVAQVPTFNQSLTTSFNPLFDDAEYRRSPGLAQIRAASVWSVGGMGQGARVQVVDTGLDLDHGELVGRATGLTDHTGENALALDLDGHGTAMAGIIAGARNGLGSVGVAPQAEVFGSRIFNADGPSSNVDLNRWLVDATDQAPAQGSTLLIILGVARR